MLNIGEKGLPEGIAQVGAMLEVNEGSFPHGIFRIEKYEGEYEEGKMPFEVLKFPNGYTNTGGALLLDLLIAAGGTAYSNANAYLGSGDSSTAFAASQTDLQAATNKLRKAMDSTFPSRASQVMTFKSTFATGDANWVWNEVAIFNAAAAGTMLCRSTGSYGTKTSAASWVLTYTLTVP